MLGPFYVAGAPKRNEVGAGYVLQGRVLGVDGCRPLPGAQIEFWLAGPDGEYSDATRATWFADEQGAYTFASNPPAPYGGRPAHIHLPRHRAWPYPFGDSILPGSGADRRRVRSGVGASAIAADEAVLGLGGAVRRPTPSNRSAAQCSGRRRGKQRVSLRWLASGSPVRLAPRATTGRSGRQRRRLARRADGRRGVYFDGVDARGRGTGSPPTTPVPTTLPDNRLYENWAYGLHNRIAQLGGVGRVEVDAAAHRRPVGTTPAAPGRRRRSRRCSHARRTPGRAGPRITCAGSPPHVSSPSVTSTTTRGPVAPARSSATLPSESAIGVRARLMAAIPCRIWVAAARSSGCKGISRSVRQESASRLPKTRSATGAPGGNSLLTRSMSTATRNLDLALALHPLQHAARGVQDDLDGATRGHG